MLLFYGNGESDDDLAIFVNLLEKLGYVVALLINLCLFGIW